MPDPSTDPLSKLNAQVLEAAEFVWSKWPTRPRLGIILGTGSGGVAEQLEIEQSIDYDQIPGFVRSTATGHKGRAICGRLGQIDTIAMQGRFHLYEGWNFDQMVFPTRMMIALGIDALVVTNAAGGVDPKMNQGDLILIESHIDLLSYWHGSRAFEINSTVQRPAVRGDMAYNNRWRQLAQAVADKNQITARSGVYVALPGPNYETRAEYRMIRKIGGDVVGMSTVPEVSIASLHQVPVLAISIVTNVAKPDALTETSGEEVVHAAKDVEPALLKIIHQSTHQFFGSQDHS